MAYSKIIRIGNSLGVTIPSRTIKSLSLQVGDQVELIQKDADSLTIFFKNTKQLFFDGLGLKTTLKKPL